jgi:hypothetical protein
VGTGVDDAVEVEVEVIEFDIVRIGGCDVDGDGDAVYFFWRLFDDSGDYFGVFFTEPAERCWDTTINFLCTFKGIGYPIFTSYRE